MFLAALRTGLRQGELIALYWEDVQFGENADDPNRFILVRRNYSRGEFTTPKNHKSRSVDMSREVRSVLLDLRDHMAMKAFERGEQFVPRLVFPSAEGGPLMASTSIIVIFFLVSKQLGCGGSRFMRCGTVTRRI